MQAAGLNEIGKTGGSVEQIVADALGPGDSPTVDSLLANLSGANGEPQSVSEFASLNSDAVSGIEAFGFHAEMQITLDIANFHHDAVRPAMNG
jgi:hypothetical protein